MRGSAPEQTLILGAGPAGLTAGYLLAQRGEEPVVLESLDKVGGLARTEVRDGYRFDLGGHRFFTKSREVEALWHETLGDELLRRPRLSRIYYRGRMLDYPLSGPNLIRMLGPAELTRALSSYLLAIARRPGEAESYEDWVSQRFGQRLYEMFFRSYTEKVWGVPCTELRAEWAAQRIRGLSFGAAVRSALPGKRRNGVRSLITEFHYPRLGPGQMWEAMRDRILELGGRVRTGARVERIRIEGTQVSEVTAGGERIPAANVISSLPLSAVAGLAEPAPPSTVLEAAAGLRYRDFITVALVLDGTELFPDNWIYVHEPGVRVARIQNFRAWSPAMVPDQTRSCVGLEYFCFQGDELWSLSDPELVELATEEFAAVGLGERDRVLGGHVVRVPKAYPIYDEQYAGRLDTIRDWLAEVENLQQVGRNGLHRYNNSDHSMLTAMRAVENLNGADHDLWQVNADSWYHETEIPEEQPYRNPSEAPELARTLGV